MPEITDTLNDTRSALNTINEQLPLLAGQITHDLEQTERALESFTATSEQIAATLDNGLTAVADNDLDTARDRTHQPDTQPLARTLEEQPQSLILGRKPPSEEP
jgi:ABC-type transporter Mla subunit MlaD